MCIHEISRGHTGEDHRCQDLVFSIPHFLLRCFPYGVQHGVQQQWYLGRLFHRVENPMKGEHAERVSCPLPQLLESYMV